MKLKKRLFTNTNHLRYYVIKVPPEHMSPSVSKQGWEYEHRYLMEKKLGRYLNPREQVYHINDDTLDNRLRNLSLVSPERINKKRRGERPLTKKKQRARANTIQLVKGKYIKWDQRGTMKSRREAQKILSMASMDEAGRRNISKAMRGTRVGATYNVKSGKGKRRKRYTYFKNGKLIDVEKEAIREDVAASTIINRCHRRILGYLRMERKQNYDSKKRAR